MSARLSGVLFSGCIGARKILLDPMPLFGQRTDIVQKYAFFGKRWPNKGIKFWSDRNNSVKFRECIEYDVSMGGFFVAASEDVSGEYVLTDEWNL